MSQDAKLTITRGNLSLTVEAKGVTAQELTFIAAAAKENLENLPWLLDQVFRQFEYAVENAKQKFRDNPPGAAMVVEPPKTTSCQVQIDGRTCFQPLPCPYHPEAYTEPKVEEGQK